MHRDTSYPGEHAAIIDDDLWGRVQRLLSENRVERTLGARAKEPSLLAGLLYDEAGERMTPSHAVKHGRRYRYYVSQSLIKKIREAAPGALRVAAEEIERAVGERLAAFLTDHAALHEAFGPSMSDAREQQVIIVEAGRLAEQWSVLSVPERREILVATRSKTNNDEPEQCANPAPG